MKIPKRIRDALGIEPGDQITFEETDKDCCGLLPVIARGGIGDHR
jgi:AbrB family looped-hinge helix DNA binding protein